jgi:hypothetical protein
MNKYIINEHKIYCDKPKVNNTHEQLHVFGFLALSTLERYENKFNYFDDFVKIW